MHETKLSENTEGLEYKPGNGKTSDMFIACGKKMESNCKG